MRYLPLFMLLAFVALAINFSSVLAAAPPNAVSIQTNIALVTHSQFSVDDQGNGFFLDDSSAAATFVNAFNKDNVPYAGCTAAGTDWATVSGLTGAYPIGLQVVTSNSFPTASTSRRLIVHVCPGATSATARCRFIAIPIATGPVPTSQCPVILNSATNVVTLGDGCAFTAPLTRSPFVVDSKNTIVFSCVQDSTLAAGVLYRTNALPSLRSDPPSSTGITFTQFPASFVSGFSDLRDMTVDPSDNIWVVANQGIYVSPAGTTSLGLPNTFCTTPAGQTTPCGSSASWSFGSTQSSATAADPNGITCDANGILYVTFGRPTSVNSGRIFSYNTANLFSSTQGSPAPWAYFAANTGFTQAFFEPNRDANGNAISSASGSMVLDPYQGRLLVNGWDRFWSIPLITVTFDKSTGVSGFTAAGAPCTVGSANCISLLTATSATATTFTTRVHAATIPNSFSFNIGLSTTQTGFSSTGTGTNANVAVSGTAAAGALFHQRDLSVTFSNQQLYPVRVELTFTSPAPTNYNAAWVFTGVGLVAAKNVFVQGSLSFAANNNPASSTGLAGTPFSATPALVGTVSRYTLVANPAVPASCTTPTLALSVPGTVSGASFNPTQLNFASGSAVVAYKVGLATLNSATPPAVNPQVWNGVWGCTTTVNGATLPTYVLNNVQVTPARTIAFTALDTLQSAATTLVFSASPNPTTTVAGTVTFSLSSATVTGSTINTATSAGTIIAAGGTTVAITNGNCAVGGATCADASAISYTPSVPAGSVAVLRATTTSLVSAFEGYYYLNDQLVPTLIPVGATSINVNSLTPALTGTISFDPTTYPASQIVSPGRVVGPYKLVVSTAGSANVQFNDNLSGNGAGRWVVTTTTTAPTDAQVLAAVNNLVSVSVSNNNYVWYVAASSGAFLGRLPGISNDPLNPAGTLSIVIPTGTFLSFAAPAGNAYPNVQILITPTFTFTTIQGLPTTNRYLWAGRTASTRNSVVMDMGFNVPSPVSISVAVTVMDITGGGTPAVATTPWPITDTARNIAVKRTNTDADFAANQFLATSQAVQLEIAAGQRTVTFFVAGAMPAHASVALANIRFRTSVLAANPVTPVTNAANYNMVDQFAVPVGQVLIDSVPASFQLGVTAASRLRIDPLPVATVGDVIVSPTESLTVSDSLTNAGGNFKLCLDTAVLCVSNAATGAGVIAISPTNLLVGTPNANLNVNNFGILHYTPSTLANTQVPRYTFTMTGSYAYAFAWNAAAGVTFTASVDATSRVTVQLTGLPAITPGVVATFMNYEAALGATPTVGSIGFDSSTGLASTSAAFKNFPYPIATNGAASTDALPLPITINGNAITGSNNEVLAGVKYAMLITLFPVPSADTSFSLSFVDSNGAVVNGNTFEYNQQQGLTTSVVGGRLYSATSATTSFLTSNEVQGLNLHNGLRRIIDSGTMGCPQNSVNADGKCAVALVFWTPARTAVMGALQVQITAAPTTPTYVNNQRMPFIIRRWCGISADLRAPIQPAQFGVQTTVPIVCPAGVPSAITAPATTPATAFVLSERNPGIAAVTQPLRGTFSLVGTAATVTDLPDSNNAYSYTHLAYTAAATAGSLYTSGSVHLKGASYLDSALTSGFISTNPYVARDFVATRVRRVVVGTYAITLVTDAQQPITVDGVNGRLTVANPNSPQLATSLPATTPTSANGFLKFFPSYTTTDTTTGFFTLSDGLLFTTGTPNTFATNVDGTTRFGGVAGLTYRMSGPARTYADFPFFYTLTDAPLVSTNFKVCAQVTTAGTYPTGNVPNRGCSNPASTPFAVTSETDVTVAPDLPLTYVAAPAPGQSPNALTVTTPNGYVIPIAVTMALTTTATNMVVGQSYTFELKTATALSSPVLNGLTVNLFDECGLLTGQSVNGVPALGTFSARQLVFKAGDVSKTFSYTPSRICAAVGAATNQLFIRVAIDTTSADQAIFVAPTPTGRNVYGAVHVEGVQRQYISGIAGPQITVRIAPAVGTALVGVNPFNAATTDLKVTVNDRNNNGVGASIGGSFNVNNVLAFTPANSAPKSLVYIAPTQEYLGFAEGMLIEPNNVISAVLTGADTALYRFVVPSSHSLYNTLAPSINPADDQLTFVSQIVADSFNAAVSASGTNPTKSIQGVFFNVIAGSSLSTATSTSLSTTPDALSSFVGNSANPAGASANLISFNVPFMAGYRFGYFATVPFSQSAVIVNVESAANTIFVNNNGWPNAKSAGTNTGYGGYVLPNPLSGYSTPVFFLSPGLNNFLVGAAKVGNPATFTTESALVSDAADAPYSTANGDGLVYRFTIARDTISALNVWVAPANTNAAAAGQMSVPWAASLPRLVATPQMTAAAPSLLNYNSRPEYEISVDFAVQNVVVSANFFGALKVQASSNLNDLANNNLVSLPNNQMVMFPLTTPTPMAGVSAAVTTLTVMGGGLGPVVVRVVRAPRSIFVTGTNIQDTPMGPCITRGATSITLSMFPNAVPAPTAAQTGALSLSLSYRLNGASTTVNVPAITVTGVTWASTTGDFAALSRTVQAPITFAANALPITLSTFARYGTGDASPASEFSTLNNHRLDYCPA